MEKKEQGTVQALERGLKILELLMQEKRPMASTRSQNARHHAVSSVSDLENAGGQRMELPDVG